MAALMTAERHTSLGVAPHRGGARRTATRAVPRPEAASSGALEDAGAFNALILEHQDLAYSVAYRILGSREAAEDATQEAFLRAYQSRAQFQDGNVRAWLMRIVSNAAIDELRRRKRRPQQAFADLHRDTEDPDRAVYDPPDASPGPEAVALHGELRQSLEAALARLSHDFRLVVVLHDVHGLTYEEIAETVGVPIGTVRSRLSRARGQLRELLREAE